MQHPGCIKKTNHLELVLETRNLAHKLLNFIFYASCTRNSVQLQINTAIFRPSELKLFCVFFFHSMAIYTCNINAVNVTDLMISTVEGDIYITLIYVLIHQNTPFVSLSLSVHVHTLMIIHQVCTGGEIIRRTCIYIGMYSIVYHIH